MKFSGLLVILLAGALSPVLYRKTLGYFDASAAASQQDKDKVNCPHCAPPRDRIIYLPLIDLPEAQSAELVFNSRSPKEAEVTPTFYKADGTGIVADPVRLKSNEIRYVDLKKLIPGPYRNDANWGGMSLAFSGMPREIWAQLRFLGINGGASVDEFFSVPTEVRSDVQEAVWWMPPGSTAVLALGNITNVATSATVRFGDGQEHAVALAPHATHIIRRAPRSQAGPESVLITITGAPGSVIPAGLIASANGAFNSAIRFYETRRAKQPDLFGNGLRLDGATPRMVLKNTSSVMITATPQFIPLRGVGGGRSVVLPSLALKPQETVEVDLGLLIKLAQDRKDLATVSVAVANSGSPGSLIGALYSSNTATGISYDVPLRDSGPVRNMTGAYPWKIDKDFTTMVHITNISNGLAEFVGEINCAGGKYLIEPRTLAAGETEVFDLREIVEGQKPDKLNRRLPANATVGQFRWTLRGVAGGKVILMGRAEMVSRAGRISSSYSCAGDCIAGYVGSLSPDYPEMIVDDQITFTAMETAFYADGYHMGPYPVSPQGLWGTDSPNAVALNEIGTCTALSPTPQAIISVNIRQVERFNWMEETQECVGDGDFYDEVGETVVTVPAPTLSGPMSITKGQSATYRVTGARASQVTDWIFTSGNVGVNGPNSTLSWGGTMVSGGTVSVIVTQRGQQINLSRSMTINPRTGFAFTAPAPTEVSNGSRCGNNPITLSVVSPPALNTAIGQSCIDQYMLYAPTIVSSGPNKDFRFVSAVMNQVRYYYLVSPDAKNTSGAFYQAQCGDYDQGNPNGFISGAVLLANIIHHESGLPANSHYAQYKTYQDVPIHNVGVEAEKQIGQPGISETAFRDQVDDAINLRRVAIDAFTHVEPCGGQATASHDATCNYRGKLNFLPYATCP